MRYAPLLAVALCGCVATPQAIIDTGERSSHALTLPPERAAACLARNIENDRGLMTSVRPRISGGGMEVTMRARPDSVIAVAEVEPHSEGSRATVWIRSEWFYRKAEFVPALIAGC